MEAFKLSFIDDWKEWSTAKKALSIIGVCCIGLIIIGVLFGGAMMDKNTSSPAKDNNNANTNNNNDAAQKGVKVKINYDGEWSGALVTGGSSKSISGSGEDTIDIDSSTHVISANAQKQDGSSGKLSIQIVKDGKVVEESDTDAEYGVASVSATV